MSEIAGPGVVIHAVCAVRMLPRWRLAAHRHPAHWQVLIVTRGRLEAVIGDRAVLAGPGDVVIYPADQVHSERNAGPGVLEGVYLGFGAPPPVGPFPTLARDPGGHLRHLADWMAQLLPSADGSSQALLLRLLGVFMDAIRVRHEPGGMVARIRDHMRLHLGERLTVGDLAAVAGLTPSHFIRVLRAASGQTPMRMLQQVRIEAACALLGTTTLPLKAIAAQVGFADQFHFSKVFRRVTGRPPSAMRYGGISARGAGG